MKAKFYCLSFIFLSIWMMIVLLSSLKKSPAIDEVPHFGAGYSYITRGDFRMNPEHPPLFKALALVPVWILDHIPLVTEGEGFRIRSWYYSLQTEFGYHVLYRSPEFPQKLLFHARLVPTLFGALGGLVLIWWGRMAGGGKKGYYIGFTAGTLLLLYPEYAGHARFLTLDVPTAVVCGAIAGAGWNWLRKSTWSSMVLYIVFLGVGSQIKLPVTVFGIFSFFITVGAGFYLRRLTFVSALMSGLIYFFTIYTICWAMAGFRFSAFNTTDDLLVHPPYVPKDGNYGSGILGTILNWLWTYKLLPETALAQIFHTRSFDLRTFYFMGEWRKIPSLFYYPVTVLLKTPIHFMVLITGAVGTFVFSLIRKKSDRTLRDRINMIKYTVLILPFFCLFIVYVMGKSNIGHRNIMFMYIPGSFAAALFIFSVQPRKLGKIVLYGALGVSGFIFVKTYPHFETYFNYIGKSPYHASRYLNDSNIDWGQDLPLLGEYLAEKYPGIPVNAAFFSLGKPEVYGIKDYHWILKDYPFALNQPSDGMPASLVHPTAVSLNCLYVLKEIYPQLVKGHPEWIGNSIVVFPPVIKIAEP